MPIIVTMASITIGSAAFQKVMEAVGRTSEAQLLDFVTRTSLVVTCVVSFSKVVKAVAGLGG